MDLSLQHKTCASTGGDQQQGFQAVIFSHVPTSEAFLLAVLSRIVMVTEMSHLKGGQGEGCPAFGL